MAAGEAIGADRHGQPRILGFAEGIAGPLLCRRAGDTAGHVTGKYSGFSQFFLARIRPAHGDLAPLRCIRRGRRARKLHAQRQDRLERRAVIDGALERGFELIPHNYEQGELLCHLQHKPDEERRVIEETLKVYERVTGRKPQGWLSSSLRGTTNTPTILVENGLKFWCDLMNDDQPYMIETPKGPIVGVPYSIEINDFTLLLRRGLTNEAVLDCMKEQFNVLYAEGERTGMMMNVGLHPHVIGVPHRAGILRKFLAYAKEFDGVWWATREEVAACYREQHATHIPPQAHLPS